MLTSHLLVFVCSGLAVATVNALPQVNFRGTTISGRNISGNIEFFGGIPFAEPPIGPLRLQPPVFKVQLNTTKFDAAEYGKACVQPPLMTDLSTQSEDCLTISIHRPAGVKPSAKLPVLLWTYGGGYLVGSSHLYNGSELVQRSIQRGTPIIYVNFNYRLGPLGFPQGQEADDQRALNLGLEDQIAVLEWLQANIHFFGGDKNKVTVFGESAGAIMIGVLLLNPRFERLARGAILESGSSNGLATFTAAQQETSWEIFVAKIPSCASVATSGHTFSCLRNATIEEITTAMVQGVELGDLYSAPTLDTGRNSLYPDLPSRIYSKGRFAKLPFIAGTNLDEGTEFASQQPLTEEGLKAMLVAINASPGSSSMALEATTDKVLELYQADPAVGSPYRTGDELFGLPASYKRHASILGDMIFEAPRRMLSQTAAKFGVKSYGYQFTDPQPTAARGVSHTAEIPYVYGQVPQTAGGASQNLSLTMMDYWISFTVSLDPNDRKGVKRLRWPQYEVKNQMLLQLEGGNTTVIPDSYRERQMAFLNKNAETLNR